MKNSFKLAAAAVALSAAFSSTVHAAGFQLTEQSAGALGRAYAGVGVDGTDLSGVYFNPATMVLHPGTQMQAGFVGIGLNLEYAGDNGTKENGREASQAIPHGFITHQINESTWVGLAMTVPFGMGTEYDSNWEHADHGISATILTFDFNPNVAWKATEKLSFGAGVSLQYAQADLKKRNNFGVVNGQIISAESEIDADSWAWGFNLGMMWSPTENFRVGVSYRSKIKHDAEGDFTLKNAKWGNASITGGNLIDMAGSLDNGSLAQQKLMLLGMALNTQSFDGYATVTAPAWAMANVAWDVNELLSLYGTFRWTDWSSFDELDITTNVTGVGGQVVNKWKDTYMGSVGADLRLTNWWTLRGGIAYETSPIDKPEYRTAIIPDARRWWFAVGSSFKFDDNLVMDLAFAHLHGVGERSLYDNGEKIGKFRKLDAYLIGAQLQYKF
ncbi:transporter [Sutterella faecalis]|uniref:Transporter n=2 Tax=Sutterella TaxID=40544 RepID=A0AAI9WMC1_9BURK|nr:MULTISPECIES: outer membrane protein transport protein [Sutterella]KAB7650058.1 transporter [Sutterella seckii]QDA53895.1 transporter [Sutterella faecalis]